MNTRNLLLLGPEEGDKNDRLEKERKELLSSFPDMEIEIFYANDNCEKEALSSLRQPSLFSSTRLVIIKYAEAIKKGSSFQTGLSEYIRNPEEGVYLIILSSDSSSPFDKNLKNLETVMFWEEFDSNKIKWIKGEFARHKFSVDQEAIEEILNSVENNKADMKSTIEMISSYYRTKDKDKRTISSEEISSVITREKGENGYSLFSQVARRDLEASLLVLASINLQDPRSLVTALSILSSEFRLLEDACRMKREGKREEEIFKEAVPLQTSFFPARPGISFKKKGSIINGMNNYSYKEIERIVLLLAEADVEIKNQGAEAYSLFQNLIYTIIVNGGGKEENYLYPAGLEIKLM